MSSAGVRAFPNTTGRRIRGHDGEIRTTELWLQGDANCSPERKIYFSSLQRTNDTINYSTTNDAMDSFSTATVDFGSVRESAYLTDLTSCRSFLTFDVIRILCSHYLISLIFFVK